MIRLHQTKQKYNKQFDIMSTNQQTNGRVLYITPGRVNSPVIEDIKDGEFMDTSIFGTQYKQMLSCLDTYVKYHNDVNDKKDSYSVDSPNNVFTFVGERGSGKTSCMSSVSKLLTTGGIHKLTNYKALSAAEFASIDIIDPSYFDKSHNIVAIMVAKLYKKFLEYDKSTDSNVCDRDYRNELIDAFAHAQRSLRCLLDDTNIQDEYASDDIENLSELSVAIDLKTDIHTLVLAFLNFVKKPKGYLVLSIDDIDLNVSEADTMAEQIRKYLVNPNIIILLAAKLDQLATVKNLHYAEKYDPLLSENRMDYSTIEEMTSQFLTKFAPHDQRVYMPTNDVYLNSEININGDTWHHDSVMQVVPEIIFNRTRYLFYNSKQTPSYIIPRNLRKMCQLVSMLWSMDSYHDADQNANKDAFRNYLFGPWIQDNLSRNDRKMVDRVLDGWKNEQLNRIALDVIKEKYTKWMEGKNNDSKSNIDKSDIQEEVKALTDDKLREFNLSVGDIMSLIDVLEVVYETHADKCFFFILKSIYSMALYEAYDILTDKQDKNEEDKNTINKEDDNQVLRYDPFEEEHIEDYHKLVGGRFYNYRMNPVLAKEKINESIFVSRSDRMISYNLLDREIKEAVTMWNDNIGEDGHVSDIHKDEIKTKVQLCEFFMLCCIRDINKRHSSNNLDYYDPSYRQSDSVYYNGDYTGKDWIFFDLGAFFFNVTRMEDCYNRYKEPGKRLCQLCQKDKDGISLYSYFLKNALEYRKDYDNPHAWQSWASIRNAEILSDLNQHLHAKCRINESGNQKHLGKFFRELANYQIKTYDRDKKGTKLNINFEFASVVADLMGNDSIIDSFEKIYSANVTVELKSAATPVVILPEDSSDCPQIDVDKLLRRRKADGNKKDSIRTYLNKNEGRGITEFKLMVEAALASYSDTLTREDVRNVGNSINLMLYSKYGTSKRNTEGTVSETGSEVAVGETSSES